MDGAHLQHGERRDERLERGRLRSEMLATRGLIREGNANKSTSRHSNISQPTHHLHELAQKTTADELRESTSSARTTRGICKKRIDFQYASLPLDGARNVAHASAISIFRLILVEPA
jgi:hypothetical protein